VALFALAALPVLASFGAYLYWTPGSGSNYGELIQPRPLPDAALFEPNGEPSGEPSGEPNGAHWMLSDLRGRWVLVHIGAARCDESCNSDLFLMRQMRLMQGKEMERVERLWLLSDEGQPDTGMLGRYEGMRIGRAPAGLLRLFPADGDPAEHIYLIDPLGNLMLRFPAAADGRKAARDIARLLRVSHVG